MIKFLFSLFLVSFVAKSQDTLIFNNSTKVVSLVLLLGQDSIRYKRIENITGVDLYAKNSEVAYVKYKNGTIKNVDSVYKLKVQRNELAAKYAMAPITQSVTPATMFEIGKRHADVNYRCKGCKAGIATETILFVPLGWLTAYAVMFVPPKETNLAYPSEELWQDENYRKGYKNQAARIKRESMRDGALIGTLSAVLVTVAVLTIQNHSNP
jgi:hypothetical protein